MKLEELVGEVLTHVDVDEDDDIIMLTTQSGRIIKIFHEQDCCETVKIQDTEGEWHSLIGKVIVDATHEEEEQCLEYCESRTDTTLKFRVNDSTVISRWVGESNGYYSESVYIRDITKGENVGSHESAE